MNSVKGTWSLLKQSMINFAAVDVDGLVRFVKRKLKKIQYRPHLIDGCLVGTGDHMHHELIVVRYLRLGSESRAASPRRRSREPVQDAWDTHRPEASNRIENLGCREKGQSIPKAKILTCQLRQCTYWTWPLNML